MFYHLFPLTHGNPFSGFSCLICKILWPSLHFWASFSPSVKWIKLQKYQNYGFVLLLIFPRGLIQNLWLSAKMHMTLLPDLLPIFWTHSSNSMFTETSSSVPRTCHLLLTSGPASALIFAGKALDYVFAHIHAPPLLLSLNITFSGKPSLGSLYCRSFAVSPRQHSFLACLLIHSHSSLPGCYPESV